MVFYHFTSRILCSGYASNIHKAFNKVISMFSVSYISRLIILMSLFSLCNSKIRLLTKILKRLIKRMEFLTFLIPINQDLLLISSRKTLKYASFCLLTTFPHQLFSELMALMFLKFNSQQTMKSLSKLN